MSFTSTWACHLKLGRMLNSTGVVQCKVLFRLHSAFVWYISTCLCMFLLIIQLCQSKPECGRQTLTELLIRPVQRLPSITLLLKGRKWSSHESSLNTGCVSHCVEGPNPGVLYWKLFAAACNLIQISWFLRTSEKSYAFKMWMYICVCL